MYQPASLPRTLQACLRDLCHAQVRVRHSALRDLARFEAEPERTPALQACLRVLREDSEGQVRAQAALTLADLQAREAEQALIDAYGDPDVRVRHDVVLALGEVARATPAVREVLTRALDDPSAALRYQSVIACGSLFSRTELQAVLHQALADPDRQVRHVGIRVAEAIYCAGVGEPGNDRELGAGDEPACLPLPLELDTALRRALGDPSPAVALVAAILLAKTGDLSARSELAGLLNAPLTGFDPEDERTAIQLCAAWGLTAARPGLERRARRLFGGGAAWEARIALARLGDARATAQIVRGLRAWTYDRRMLAIHAAGQARLKAAVDALQTLHAQPQRADREAVQRALQLIAGHDEVLLSAPEPSLPRK